MLDVETLFTSGLSHHLLPAWTVIFYVVISSIFVLMRRIPLYLLTTHAFCVYWGFVLYWAKLLSGANSNTTAFAVYIFCAFAITSLAIVAYFKGSSYNLSVAE